MQETFTLVGMWETMGWVARAVVIVLAIMSVYSLGLAIERALRFRRARKESVGAAGRISELLDENRLEDADDLTRRNDYKNSHIARVLGAGIRKYRQIERQELPEEFDSVAAANRALDREKDMTVADMKRGLGNLATISTTAPFIGLFGTVVGIINAFQGMAASGSGGLGAVSAGIAEALAATAFGLFVAIPAVWLYNYFIGKIDRFQVEMNNASSELVDFLIQREVAAGKRSAPAPAATVAS
ncbi:MAG: MotA/TolQ/ExbB proton channel family protein [Thermoanaerobaculia bacterium]|nr:MotA/TolQ/ExbB proton channel family protein [Thermoanaerobaculia bacterium]